MVTKENGNVRILSVGFLFILSFFYFVNPLTRTALGIFMIFLGITILIYSLKDYQGTLIGITKKSLGKSIFIASVVSVVFFIVAKLVPAFSVLYPNLPNAVSDQLRWFTVILIAPVGEELFFRGSLLGYLRRFKTLSKKRIWIAILISAMFFSVFHIVAYAGDISGLANFSQVFASFGANISSFVSAFIVGILFGYLAVKTDNLWTTIIAHSLLNLIIFSLLSVVII